MRSMRYATLLLGGCISFVLCACRHPQAIDLFTAEEQKQPLVMKEVSRSAKSSAHIVLMNGAEAPHFHDRHNSAWIGFLWHRKNTRAAGEFARILRSAPYFSFLTDVMSHCEIAAYRLWSKAPGWFTLKPNVRGRTNAEPDACAEQRGCPRWGADRRCEAARFCPPAPALHIFAP